MPDKILTDNIPEEPTANEAVTPENEAVEPVVEPAPEAVEPAVEEVSEPVAEAPKAEEPVASTPIEEPAPVLNANKPVEPSFQPTTTQEDEMELNVSLDQLSYICEYCGKVNPIAAASCGRCGKRRPRSEYVNAMNRIKNAQSVKERYVQEQAKLAADRQDAAQQQLARLVEERVADERAHYMAQEKIRFEEEQEAIRRSTARDAVLRIIAAEKAADEKVQAAEKRAEEAESGRSREVEERIAEEREKVLYAAAKRVVSERAGIENAAEERIIATKKDTERRAQENIAFAIEEAEKNAARRAVLKVVATEQAANDRTRLERDAIARAALDRVEEEKKIAEINAYSKYKMEREAIERAVDERIKAEREALYSRRGEVSQRDPGTGMGVGVQQVQPLAIVPYVNSRQPLFQYSTAKTYYKFVPDAPEQPVSPAPTRYTPAPVQPKQKKKQCMRVWSFVLMIVAIALVALSIVFFKFVENFKTIDIVTSLFQSNDYKTAFEGTGMWMEMILPIGIAVLAVGAVLTIISAFVGGVFTKKFNWAIFVGCLLMLLGAAAAFVSPIIAKKIEIADITKHIHPVIVLAVTLIAFIISLVLAIKQTKKNKQAKAAL